MGTANAPMVNQKLSIGTQSVELASLDNLGN